MLQKSILFAQKLQYFAYRKGGGQPIISSGGGQHNTLVRP